MTSDPPIPVDHILKSWPEPFTAVLDGVKRYEVRKADRDFKVGDVLYLREWLPAIGVYTGRAFAVRVTYMTSPGEFDLPTDVCVLGIADPDPRSIRRGGEP